METKKYSTLLWEESGHALSRLPPANIKKYHTPKFSARGGGGVFRKRAPLIWPMWEILFTYTPLCSLHPFFKIVKNYKFIIF